MTTFLKKNAYSVICIFRIVYIIVRGGIGSEYPSIVFHSLYFWFSSSGVPSYIFYETSRYAKGTRLLLELRTRWRMECPRQFIGTGSSKSIRALWMALLC